MLRPLLFVIFLLSLLANFNIVNSSGALEVQLPQLPIGSNKVIVCLKEVYATVLREPCAFGRVSVDLTNNVDMMVVKVPYTFRWPGAFTLVVSVLGRDLETELARFAVVDEWVVPNIEWRTHSKLKYRVMCHQHYHGNDCAIFCRDRDDTYGHYRCNARGIKECLDGWKGADCDKPVCSQGCNEQHGFCQRPHECQCRPGWNGQRCDQCVEYPGCVHGYCVSPWQCICHRNWGGILCDQDLNYCGTHQPCLNDGQCENVAPDQYRCQCKKGFAGVNCEIVLDPCATSPCINGGTCISNGNNSSSFSCLCPAGWTGHRCEHNVNECLSRPCRNSGTCIDLINDFRCLCPQGWTGRECDIDVDECHSLSPCIHATRCINLMGSFQCECVHGFNGQLCEVNVNECASAPCLNGGTCIDLVGEYQCVCPIGYTGTKCDKVDESVCHQVDGRGKGWWEVVVGEGGGYHGCEGSRLCHCDRNRRVKCFCVTDKSNNNNNNNEHDMNKCLHDSDNELMVEFESGINMNKTSSDKVCSIVSSMIFDEDIQINTCCEAFNENTIRIGILASNDDVLQAMATKITRASLRTLRVRSVSLSLSSHTSVSVIIVIILVSALIFFMILLLIYYRHYHFSHNNIDNNVHHEPVRRVHNILYSSRPKSLNPSNPNNSPNHLNNSNNSPIIENQLQSCANNERPQSVVVCKL